MRGCWEIRGWVTARVTVKAKGKAKIVAAAAAAAVVVVAEGEVEGIVVVAGAAEVVEQRLRRQSQQGEVLPHGMVELVSVTVIVIVTGRGTKLGKTLLMGRWETQRTSVVNQRR